MDPRTSSSRHHGTTPPPGLLPLGSTLGTIDSHPVGKLANDRGRCHEKTILAQPSLTSKGLAVLRLGPPANAIWFAFALLPLPPHATISPVHA